MCHSNEQMHGKGGAHKADDFMSAFGCSNCHRRYDTGPEPAEVKQAWFKLAHYRTLRILFNEGWVGVLRRAVIRHEELPVVVKPVPDLPKIFKGFR